MQETPKIFDFEEHTGEVLSLFAARTAGPAPLSGASNTGAVRIEEGMKERRVMSVDIVVVDDEKPIADLVELYLQNEGYTIHKFYTGREAIDYIQSGHTDLAVLDLMLPDVDGFTICKTIREKFYFPIIMLTAKVEDVDKIMGLTIGADGYITKPFNPLELVARVKTQLRRTMQYNRNCSPADAGKQDSLREELEIRGLRLNKSSHKCYLYENPVTLTPLEFSILWYLCEHQGKVVSSEQLFEDVWGEKFLDNNNTVMAHIRPSGGETQRLSQKSEIYQNCMGSGVSD